MRDEHEGQSEDRPDEPTNGEDQTDERPDAAATRAGSNVPNAGRDRDDES